MNLFVLSSYLSACPNSFSTLRSSTNTFSVITQNLNDLTFSPTIPQAYLLRSLSWLAETFWVPFNGQWEVTFVNIKSTFSKKH